MKKILVFMIVFFFCLRDISALELDIKAENAVLYSINEERILYEKNSDANTSIASITKIMTILVVLDKVKNLDEKIELTEDVFYGLREADASVAGFKVSDSVTIRDLIYGALLPSGADATNALAIYISGNETSFVKLMNEKAKSIGMNKTIFKNASGLDAEGQNSTVLDVLTMLKYALKNNIFKNIFSTSEYTTTNNIYLESTLRKYTKRYGVTLEYVHGGKTGYTGKAGMCMATVASLDGVGYILITTKSPYDGGYPHHMTDAKIIYEYFFNHYGYQKILSKETYLTTVPVKNSSVKEMKFYATKDISMYLPNNYDMSLVTYSYKGLDILSSMNKKGSQIGTYDVYYDKELVGSIKLFVNERIPFSLFLFIENHYLILVSIAILIVIGCSLILHFKKFDKLL